MAFHPPGGPPGPISSGDTSSAANPFAHTFQFPTDSAHPPVFPSAAPFDILEWYPKFLSCYRYFLEHAQHSGPVLALAAFINVKLPFQKNSSSNFSSASPAGPAESSYGRTPPYSGLFPPPGPDPRRFTSPSNPTAAHTALLPYIRRLVVTGHDTEGIMHGFFGDDWAAGVGPLHEIERRNYLFASKSADWLRVKQAYDMGPEEMVPFLSPLRNVTETEIHHAENTWSEWLAMQDWMLGPRAPESLGRRRDPDIKIENEGRP